MLYIAFVDQLRVRCIAYYLGLSKSLNFFFHWKSQIEMNHPDIKIIKIGQEKRHFVIVAPEALVRFGWLPIHCFEFNLSIDAKQIRSDHIFVKYAKIQIYLEKCRRSQQFPNSFDDFDLQYLEFFFRLKSISANYFAVELYHTNNIFTIDILNK